MGGRGINRYFTPAPRITLELHLAVVPAYIVVNKDLF